MRLRIIDYCNGIEMYQGRRRVLIVVVVQFSIGSIGWRVEGGGSFCFVMTDMEERRSSPRHYFFMPFLAPTDYTCSYICRLCMCVGKDRMGRRRTDEPIQLLE